jgi:hypothetical protein
MLQSLTPANAPLVILAFLATAALGGIAAVGTGAAVILNRRLAAKRLTFGGLFLTGGYLAVLLIFSFWSEEKTLKLGDRKYFCEIDCHLAYSIERVSTVHTLGRPPQTTTAKGTFYVVGIKTWFDPNTIASFRGNAPLKPNPREVFLVDDSGRLLGPSPAGLAALEQERGSPSTPLSRELRPGESYTTTLVFDLPSGVRRPRLLLGDPPGVEMVLIGHENSLFHKKIYFALS